MTIQLFAVVLAGLSFVQAPKTEELNPAEMKLEDFLSKAVGNSADVALAEAKVRLAEAELLKARQAAIAKYTASYYKLQSAKKLQEIAHNELDLASKQLGLTATSQTEVKRARLEYEAANISVMKLSAELNATKTDRLQTIGLRVPQADAPDPPAPSLLAANPQLADLSANQKRFLEMLDTEIEIDSAKLKPREGREDEFDVADFFASINRQLALQIGKNEIPKWHAMRVTSPIMGKMPLGSLLELIQDGAGGVFILREYGYAQSAWREDVIPADQVDNFRNSMPAVKLWKQLKAAKAEGGKEKGEGP